MEKEFEDMIEDRKPKTEPPQNAPKTAHSAVMLPMKNRRKKKGSVTQEQYLDYVNTLDAKLRARIIKMYCLDFKYLNYTLPWVR